MKIPTENVVSTVDVDVPGIQLLPLVEAIPFSATPQVSSGLSRSSIAPDPPDEDRIPNTACAIVGEVRYLAKVSFSVLGLEATRDGS